MPESGPQGQPDEAMIDLLIKQVTDGLSPAEQRELDVLDSAVASGYLRDFEKAAAAVSLAAGLPREQLPQQLQARLERDAAQFFPAAVPPATSAPAPVGPAAVAPDNVVPLTSRPTLPSTVRPRGGVAGWFAAAACLLLAIFFWARTPREGVQPPVAVVEPPPPPVVVTPKAPPAPPTNAQLRDELLARADSIKVTLGPTKDPAAAGVSADVVWDPVAQKGYLHFVGLAPNDPRVRQYQAWIFDKDRDARYPVDAGVFDVSPDTHEIIVPIQAAVPIRTAAAFAVTVEKAGGAVVSGREHVVALGKVS